MEWPLISWTNNHTKSPNSHLVTKEDIFKRPSNTPWWIAF